MDPKDFSKIMPDPLFIKILNKIITVRHQFPPSSKLTIETLDEEDEWNNQTDAGVIYLFENLAKENLIADVEPIYTMKYIEAIDSNMMFNANYRFAVMDDDGLIKLLRRMESEFKPEQIEISLEIRAQSLIMRYEEGYYLVHTFDPESKPFKILDYLMKHPGELLPWSRVKLEADAVEYTNPPSEFARQAGFNTELLKNSFFPTRSKTNIAFMRTVKLSQAVTKKMVAKLNVIKPK